MVKTNGRVPLIVVDPATPPAFSLFNPNDWEGESKAMVVASAAQFGLLLHSAHSVEGTFQAGAAVCRARLEELRSQWRVAQWDLAKLRYWVEVPTVHLFVHGFLSTGKSLLDLLAQLSSSVGLVLKKMHGFHKKGGSAGGEFLAALTSRPASGKADVACALGAYLQGQKAAWIDEFVRARDDMAHPKRGMSQVMWELDLCVDGRELACRAVVPPTIGGVRFDSYVRATATNFAEVCTEVLRALRTA